MTLKGYYVAAPILAAVVTLLLSIPMIVGQERAGAATALGLDEVGDADEAGADNVMWRWIVVKLPDGLSPNSVSVQEKAALLTRGKVWDRLVPYGDRLWAGDLMHVGPVPNCVVDVRLDFDKSSDSLWCRDVKLTFGQATTVERDKLRNVEDELARDSLWQSCLIEVDVSPFAREGEDVAAVTCEPFSTQLGSTFLESMLLLEGSKWICTVGRSVHQLENLHLREIEVAIGIEYEREGVEDTTVASCNANVLSWRWID